LCSITTASVREKHMKANPPTRTSRPFRLYDPDSPFPPGSDNPPVCGEGKDTQIDVHEGGNLFDIPATSSPLHFPELTALSRALNTVYRRQAAGCLRRKRREWGQPSLELTLALHGGGVYLVYSVPKARRKRKKA
jgi:hypothetical protein